MDYVFSHMGISNDNNVNYPVMMTEPICNPNYSRSMVSELMFECYGVPALSYGVDSLLALYGKNPKQRNALIIQSGYTTSHVIPVING